MSMFEKIQEDLKSAMLSRDQTKVSTLRLVVSAASNARIAKGGDLTDDEVTKIIQKESRERIEAMESARSLGRTELVEKANAEKKILDGYLPEQMSQEKLEEIVVTTIHEIGATSPSDMGKVMAAVMAKVKGQVDGAKVSHLVSSHLGS